MQTKNKNNNPQGKNINKETKKNLKNQKNIQNNKMKIKDKLS